MIALACEIVVETARDYVQDKGQDQIQQDPASGDRGPDTFEVQQRIKIEKD